MGKIILVAMLSLSLGLHWTFLQSAAWVGMIASYSRDLSFTQAVHKALDGQHPCALCKIVESGKKGEEKQGARKFSPKLDPYVLPPRFMLIPRSCLPVLAACPAGRGTLAEPPPFPPPRPGFTAS